LHPFASDFRLEQWLSGATADVWLRMQLVHDLWQARQGVNHPQVMPAVARGGEAN